MTENLFDLLSSRGFVAQSTDAEMRKRLETPVAVYIGFDPTADSLHVGSLVPIMGLRWIQQCGHKPLVLVGGATALVGDPSGKTAMRQMLTREDIDRNAQAIAKQISSVVRFDDSATGAKLVNNADWLATKNWIELLREVGPHFSVNRMLTMDSVKGRMESGGISFLEFNYMVMQAYDFAHLYRAEKCTVQMGGQDQWGNIVMGMELGRRTADADLAGLTFPLVTKSDGGKFGKSEKGNIWLSAERTPVYEFFQFWRNVSDSDVAKFLGFFTTLPMSEVKTLTEHRDQRINHAKEVLAFEVTKLIHGEQAATEARNSAKAAFGDQKDTSGSAIPHAGLPGGLPARITDLLIASGFAKSNGEAKRLIVDDRCVRINDEQISNPSHEVTHAHMRDGCIVLKVGKKKIFRFDV